jgi:uncharacterized membrane protein HdeD (DUF308 family)
VLHRAGRRGFRLLSRDPRWSSWRVLVQTFLIAVGLLLVGAARAWAALDHDNPLTWAYLAGLVGAALALLALYLSLERPLRNAPAAQAT